MDWFVLALLLPIMACAVGLAVATVLIHRDYHHNTPEPLPLPPKPVDLPRQRWITNGVGIQRDRQTEPPKHVR